MAKSKKKQRKAKPSPQVAKKQTETTTFIDQLEKPRNIVIFFVLLFIFLIFFYKPIVLEGLDVTGSDFISSIGNNKQIKEFQEETGKRPLWNPYMFAGTPVYYRHGGISWSIDKLIRDLNALIDWRVWYFWLGAIGMFLLAKYLGLSAITGMMAAIGYILIPHFHALVVVGHFSKLRAIMWIPLVCLTFLRFLEKRNLLSMFLFTMVFALQIRTQHYQIIFYTGLLLLFMGLVPYFRLVNQKKWLKFLKFNGLFISSIILVIAIVVQPLFVTRDYTPYSTRGGQSVSIEQEVSEKDKKGVGFDYATQWSYSISEFWNLIIPKFHGGTSQEEYEGDAVPQLKNQVIPSYWGELPFTQSYEYMSVILVFLALIGILYRWQRLEVKSLTFLTGLALLLSLGKNFSPLYKMFFYYFPYFDKFRVPMMILTLVAFNVCVLAAFGLDYLLQQKHHREKNWKKFYGLSAIFVILLLIPLLFGSTFSLSPPGEIQRYAAQYGNQAERVVEMLKQARLEIMQDSTTRTLLLFIVFGGLILASIQKWIKTEYAIISVVFLIIFDLGIISHDYLKGKFRDPDKIETQNYQETEIDRTIEKDTTLYRVLPPLQKVANDSRWPYFHQSIGGYSPAKLQVIQDIIENNLPRSTDPGIPFNLDIVSMLNGKYIVSRQNLRHSELQYLGSNSQNKLKLYLNKSVLPRAFFVDSVQVIEDGVERLKFMNTRAFNPGKIAILERPLDKPVNSPDSSFAKVINFEPDKITLKAYTNKTALLVLSEVYYPQGWKAFLETEEELRIYKTNHLLRSVVIPSGNHTITFRFHPQTYFTGITISWIGWLITYLGILLMIYREYGERIKRWVSQKNSQ